MRPISRPDQVGAQVLFDRATTELARNLAENAATLPPGTIASIAGNVFGGVSTLIHLLAAAEVADLMAARRDPEVFSRCVRRHVKDAQDRANLARESWRRRSHQPRSNRSGDV
jgi:hypothetical protein